LKMKSITTIVDIKRAKEVVKAYEELLARALEIVGDVPFYHCVDDDKNAALTFDGDEAVLSWCSYESDYYGGGSISHDEGRFPVSALMLTDTELSALRKKVKEEEAEKQNRLRRAQEAVRKEREEERDRTEYARLSAKFRHKPPKT
jgi:hypothetical protein